jgi:hypothetical protein
MLGFLRDVVIPQYSKLTKPYFFLIAKFIPLALAFVVAIAFR